MIDTMFSYCRTWRYTLSRRWTQDVAPRFVNFILLNPLTADETLDDRTICRCIGFAKREGFEAMVVTNLFAFRATKFEDLKRVADPIGEDNDAILFDVAHAADLVILAWGNDGMYRCRDAQVFGLLKDNNIRSFAFGWTKLGQPRHPLYLRADTQLVEVKCGP